MRPIATTTLVLTVLVGEHVAVNGGVQQSQSRYRFPPQELGLLESPDRDAWQRPNEIMDALNIADGSTVADFGAGGGWFAIRLARRVGPNGRVYAVDFRPEMISGLDRRIAREQLTNVIAVRARPDDAQLPSRQVDAIVIVNSYAALPAPVPLLRSLTEALRPGGRLGVVDFHPSGGGPGPPPGNRVDPSQVIRDAREAGLRVRAEVDDLPYQFVVVLEP
ncbi:MAG: class I SAM-dependent methyltransferase [Vicinamibacterales bacterium]|mgnify:FL=1|jgi:SAM-dependent methyltransferase|nr:SAM-dependent methyltransferase [Acidobacteriota bacterium]MDP7294058.1 class I SAM-dependent methyltransferase [Vicinamibacterales bacterium]MDP7473172.1 class I SAM-dependent methyltransferase [Vicinamibacterales bacterium]MDP7672089.1 class I SAM-dependent methyltransferase [Vicinamibacterales bacterium]HJO39828.1 class I SAM-dependent methyltransferase [Vicinamibacterales bacterium]|tara:strand:+ start:632 stop:1291 length:660 start_codon:yes stop_codon:yes gene_type:complete